MANVCQQVAEADQQIAPEPVCGMPTEVITFHLGLRVNDLDSFGFSP